MSARAAEHPRYPHLFTPLPLGKVLLRNRVVQLPTSTLLARDGLVTDEHIAFYERRARGGVGLIVTEGLRVHPTDAGPGAVAVYDPRVVPGLRRLAERVKAAGAAIVGQILHSGRQQHGRFPRLVWAPSAVPCPYSGIVPHAMTLAEVEEMRDHFIRSAVHLYQAGFDGVEVHGSHGHLIQQFLSPISNRREDRYGGDFAGRLRFALEVIQGIRDAVPRDFIVAFRLCADEFTPGGIDLTLATRIAQALVERTRLDYISVSQANFISIANHIPDRTRPPHPFVHYAAAIRQAVPLPVVGTGRIRTPEEAEALLREGFCDLVGMTRPLICDPDWVERARRGAAESIRRCIYCNYCWQRITTGRPIGCVHNPYAGNEHRLGAISRAARPLRVEVVGGGPAGMAAAEAAAERGHRVTLWEAAPELGGQMAWAARIPGHEEYAAVVDYLRRRLVELDVDVRLGVRVDAETLRGRNADAVVVATGARPTLDELPDLEGTPVVLAWHLLQGGVERLPRGCRRVLLLDDDGYVTSFVAAQTLADAGLHVMFVTRRFAAGLDLPAATLTRWLELLDRAGTVFCPNAWLHRVEEGRPVLRHMHSGRETVGDPVDAVVLAGAMRSDDRLYGQLLAAGFRKGAVYLVGDAVAPRGLADAVAEGHRVGRSLGDD